MSEQTTGGPTSPLERRLVGRRLDEVEFGLMLRLHFAGGFELQVESGVLLVTADGDQQVPADVAAGTAGSSAVSGLVGRTVTDAELLTGPDAGGLRLGFGDGVELRAQPDAEYEAWNLTGPDRQRTISLPGGDIGTWAADPPSRVRWFGYLPSGRTRDDPAGVYRRTVTDEGYHVDEAFTRNLRWERTHALRDQEVGRDDREFVEITEEEATAFTRRIQAASGT